MSGISIFKAGLVAGACVGGLTLSGCATSPDSRYGGVADYESGGDCYTNPCGPVQPSNVVYTDCGTVQAPGCAPAAPVYQPPAYQPPLPVEQPPVVEYIAPPVAAPVDCPVGTTPNGDGSCMMSDMSSTYTHTTTTTSSYTGETADCPPGTTPAGDGTCLQGSSSSSVYSGSSATIYEHSSATEYADCPAGSVRSASGTCTISSGYTPAPTYTAPTTYLPVRK